MNPWLKRGAVVAMVVTAVACGKSEAQKQAEQAAEDAKKAAEAMADAGGDAAKGMAEMAKAMQGMADAMGGGKTVDPASLEALQAALPQVPGWERKEPTGERMTSPMPFSQAETTYTKGASEVDVKIVDTGFAQMLVAPWSMMMAVGYEKQTSDGHEKATTVGGNPGFERWNKETKEGELNVLVSKRFMLTLEGRELSDIATLHDLASTMNWGALDK